MDSLPTNALCGSHLGRNWRALFTRSDRFVTTALEVERTPGDWTRLERLTADTWPTERGMRWGIEDRLDAHFGRR